MNIVHIIFLIIVTSLSISKVSTAQERNQQSQILLGTKHGVKNLFKTTLIDPVGKVFTRKKHFLPTTMCVNDPYENVISVIESNNAQQLLDFLKGECKPWSLNQKCDCSIRCPDDYRIIKDAPFNQSFNVDKENSFPFRNGIDDFADSKFKNEQGFCWGHAIGTQRFNRLAVFDEDEVIKDKKGKTLLMGTSEWEKIIKKKINLIFRNNFVIFPGFKNLEHLASTPPFDGYIKDNIARKWANEAMSFQGMGILLNTEVDSAKKIDRILVKLMDRINQGIALQFVFNGKKTIWPSNEIKPVTHVVLVSKYTVDKDKITLCMRDSSKTIESNQKCENQLIFTKDQNNQYIIQYTSEWVEIGGLRLGHNEDKDFIKQIKSVRNYCRKYWCEEN